MVAKGMITVQIMRILFIPRSQSDHRALLFLLANNVQRIAKVFYTKHSMTKEQREIELIRVQSAKKKICGFPVMPESYPQPEH